MKSLLDFIGFMIIVFLIAFLFSGVGIHSLSETDIKTDYKTKDIVYIFPDTITTCAIESALIFTSKHKDEVTKIKTDETFYQLYTVVYTDKNGVKHKLKIKSELLTKKEIK